MTTRVKMTENEKSIEDASSGEDDLFIDKQYDSFAFVQD